MFGSSYQIARIWGIPVKIHVSLILLLLYVGLSGGIAAGRQYGWATGGLAVFTNIALMVLVFASVALHELGHSFIALRKGCRVRGITLMIIGGAAQMESIPTRPRDEFLMAAAGPLVSLALGLATLTTGTWMRQRGFEFSGFLLFNLGVINLILAGFNLLPAFPMDGGRILRAALSNRMSRLRATYAAAQVGKWIAVLMGILGLVNRNWFLVAIAFFIYSAAGAEYRMLAMQETFKSTRNVFDGFGFPGAADRFPSDHAGWQSGGPWGDADDQDEAIISPPPYRKGPSVRVGLRREDRWR